SAAGSYAVKHYKNLDTSRIAYHLRRAMKWYPALPERIVIPFTYLRDIMKKLLKEINDSNILLQVIDGELKVFAEDPGINPGLLAEIRANKSKLTRFLLDNGQKQENDRTQAAIPRVAEAADHPLSSAQRRLWVLSQLEEGNRAYNIPAIYILEGELREDALQASLEQLVKRHEILRTVFREGRDGEIRQVVRHTGFSLGVRDIRHELAERGEGWLAELLSGQVAKVFDLSEGPLLRADVYRTAERQWVLVYVMHHIISDGWSTGVMIRELMTSYNARVRGED